MAAFVPRPSGPPDRRPLFLVLPLIAILHLFLVLALIWGLQLRAVISPPQPEVQITMESERLRPPDPPPVPRPARPEKTEAPPPEIEIAPAPSAITATPQGVMEVAPGGNGTGGNGARGASLASAAPPVPVADPNCETVDAYTARVRTAISRFFDYSPQARDARIQGEVDVHFLSDPGGRIRDQRITASRLEHIYPGNRSAGHTYNLAFMFNRTGPDRWIWQAVMHDDGGPDLQLGSGTASADGDNGLLHTPGRFDDVVILTVPDSFPAAVPRLELHLGHAADLLLLEKSVHRALDLAQPLPRIPDCLKLKNLDALMPFRFHLDTRP